MESMEYYCMPPPPHSFKGTLNQAGLINTWKGLLLFMSTKWGGGGGAKQKNAK